MGRRRKGCVFLEKTGLWRGRFSVNMAHRKKIRNVVLGRSSEMTKDQAREKLTEIMRREDALEPQRRFLTYSEMCLPVQWKDTQAVTAGRRGAFCEFVVALDLMTRGCEVYKPLNPASYCDLLAVLPDLSIVRIEAKSAQWNGKKAYTKIDRNIGKFDFLALVTDENQVLYIAASGITSTYVHVDPTCHENPAMRIDRAVERSA